MAQARGWHSWNSEDVSTCHYQQLNYVHSCHMCGQQKSHWLLTELSTSASPSFAQGFRRKKFKKEHFRPCCRCNLDWTLTEFAAAIVLASLCMQSHWQQHFPGPGTKIMHSFNLVSHPSLQAKSSIPSRRTNMMGPLIGGFSLQALLSHITEHCSRCSWFADRSLFLCVTKLAESRSLFFFVFLEGSWMRVLFGMPCFTTSDIFVMPPFSNLFVAFSFVSSVSAFCGCFGVTIVNAREAHWPEAPKSTLSMTSAQAMKDQLPQRKKMCRTVAYHNVGDAYFDVAEMPCLVLFPLILTVPFIRRSQKRRYHLNDFCLLRFHCNA